MACFFKPSSQKEPETLSWRILDKSLIIGKYIIGRADASPSVLPRKIAAFDLDDTLISATRRNDWGKSGTGWKWWDISIPGILKQLHARGYLVVVVSNQGGISLKDNPKTLQKDTASLSSFKDQLSAVLRQLDLPISVYAATAQDMYRKPRIGMWREILEDYDLEAEGAVDLAGSFYVGDAAGRDKSDKRQKDHACSDRDWAANIGIDFKTPEEFFLKQPEESFVRVFEPKQHLTPKISGEVERPSPPAYTRLSPKDIVLLCGSPGAGKSTFYHTTLYPLGYERVNQDTLKRLHRCWAVARDHLHAGKSVAVDNTNGDVDTRASWIKLARELEIPIRCVHFTASTRLCEHNDCVRALSSGLGMNPEGRRMLPAAAFRAFAQRFVEPDIGEGFQDVTRVKFMVRLTSPGSSVFIVNCFLADICLNRQFQGTPEQRRAWSQYWVSKFST